VTDFTTLRARMVDSQLKTEAVTDLAVLAAMGAVPRERFVPDAFKPLAYLDDDLPIAGANGAEPRYLMEPAPLARLIQAAAIQPDHAILDVGAGTGYAAAVLARLGSRVVALESDPTLARAAERNLADLGVANASVVTAPLEAGYPAGGPYDAIVVEGAVEAVPPALLAQLKPRGVLVAVVGYGRSAPATVFTCGEGETGHRIVFNADVRPLPGFRQPQAFVF
jgi:protein-L-isoaspartate(D-aspartate) O-methyltransferase